MKTLKLLAIFSFIGVSLSFVGPVALHAAVNNPATGAVNYPQQGAVNQPASFTLVDPLGVKNFCDLVRSLLNIVLAIGVPVAVLFLVWSGFRFILARGNPTELGIARKNFYFVIIGIAIFLGAWTLATIISATIQTLDSSNTIQFCGR